MGKPLLERFESKVFKTEYCWIWDGAVCGNGRGKMNIFGKTITAARVSYSIHVGDIPDNMYVLHRCDNRKCVNPEHLFLGTQKDNMQDMVVKGRLRGSAGILGSDNPKSTIPQETFNLLCSLLHNGSVNISQFARDWGVNISTLHNRIYSAKKRGVL